MIEISIIELWQKFALAILIGLLMGLEREHSHLEKEATPFAGIRTFPFIALLGAMAALLSTENFEWIYAISFIGLIILVVTVYAISAYKGEAGLTTEIVALLTFLIGGMIYWDYVWLSISLGVIITILLASRTMLRDLVTRIDHEDIYATLKFAVVSAVILPLLPNETYGPLNILNPFQLWLMVVFVSAVSFSGYLAIKLVGARYGIWLTGLFGGLVSSTAAIFSLSERSREEPSMDQHLSVGVVLSIATMFFRVILELFAFNQPLAEEVWFRVVLLIMLSLAAGFYLWKKTRSKEMGISNFNNPFRLWPAIQIGLLFGIILLVTKAANIAFGETGLYITSFLSGLTKIDPIVLSLSQLAGTEITYEIASRTLFLAISANVIAKIGLVTMLGSAGLKRSTLPILSCLAFLSLVNAFWSQIP